MRFTTEILWDLRPVFVLLIRPMRPSDFDTVPTNFDSGLAVVIGINSYTNSIPPLFNAVRDANAVADTLQRQGFEVLRLLDETASLASLSLILSQHLPSLQPPPDRLLIYFAGHGLAHTDEQNRLSGFLLPADARRDDLSTYWPMATLREALRDLHCRHLLLILDCCFAGAFPHASSRDLRAPDFPAPLFLERFRHFSSRRSFQLLVSTAHDELASDRLLSKPSQESLGDGCHSPFALALLQALQHPSPADINQDGLLTASELSTFLRDRLIDLLPSRSQQTPALWPLDWHDSGEFLFLLSDSFPTLPLAAPLSQRSNPYLGLRPFSSAHRHLFFGREQLVDSLLDRLRAHPLLLLCGPSGAGKSSSVHAGLLPRLGDDPTWRVPPSLRPSVQPLHALSAWLAALEPGQPAPSTASLAMHPRAAAECVRSFLSRHVDLSLLLVVDPLEELVTTCLDEASRWAFLRALSGLLQLAHPRLRLLWLLRADFEPHFRALLQPSGLSSTQWHASRLSLPPMNRDELRRCIEKPAEACVLFFEPGLIERLLDDVEQMPGALPLLSVALSELFDAYIANGRDDRILAFEDYRCIGGGISGALQRRAELVFAGTPPPLSDGQCLFPALDSGELPAFQHTLRNVLLRMVSSEGGELTRRRVSRAELEYAHPEENARVRRALRTLEACRLVVASDDGGPCVEPAHDALLSAWPRLHDWARLAQRELLLLRRVSHAASEWHRHRQSNDFLWADGRLDQLGLASVSLRRTDEPLALSTVSPGNRPTESLGFNTVESGFLRASAARRRYLRTRRSSLGLTVVIALVLLTLAALFQADLAQTKAREAEASAWEARQQKETAEVNAWKAVGQQLLSEANAEDAKHNARRVTNQQQLAEASAREAVANATRASEQQRLAEASAQRASEQQQLAEFNAREALSQKNASEANAREARRQRESAERNAREASEQQQLAETNAREALSQRNASEANAREARNQQKSAEANAGEARRQQRFAEANALEAYKQQGIAELNFWEAQLQQQTATANAREAQRQRDAAEANALEARKQQRAAEDSAEEARKQKERAIFSSLLFNARGLIDSDPTKALLFLLELNVQNETSANEWLQTALDVGQRVFSRSILSVPDEAVMMARFSPDGAHVLTALSDGTARLWNTDGKGEPRVFQGHEKHVNSATFSPDGTRVLTASDDGTARLWNADGTGKPIVFRGHEDSLTSAMFSPDGTRVLTVSADGTARLWNADGTGKPIVFEDQEQFVTSAMFSPDGTRILTIWTDCIVRLWNANGTGEPILLEGHSNWVNSATFSPDGLRVLTASDDRTARLWDASGMGELRVFSGHLDRVNSATFSPDGLRILTASTDGTALLWMADGMGEPIVFSGHENRVNSAIFSSNGAYVLTASDDGTARLWRVDGWELPLVFAGHQDFVTSAIFSPDGSHVLTLSDDATARIWSIGGSGAPFFDVMTDEMYQSHASLSSDGSHVFISSDEGDTHLWRADGTGGQLTLKGHENWVNSVAFSPDGTWALTASDDNTARLWHVGSQQKPLVLQGHQAEVKVATFSPNGLLVLTAAVDGTARLQRTDGTGESRVLEGHEAAVTVATFSPNDSFVLTVAEDGTARLQRTDGTGESRVLEGHEAAVTVATFSPDSLLVLTAAEDGTARLQRTDGTGKPLSLKGHKDAVSSAAFNLDGSLVVTTSEDNTARLWRTNGRGESIVLQGHRHPVESARFSPDGRYVLTVSMDGTARRWRLDDLLAPLIPDDLLAPLVLQHEEVFNIGETIHAAFLPNDAGVLTVCQGGRVRIWPTNPDRLRERLQKATTACLSPRDREQYLLEEPSKAREAHAHCESSHGRAP